MQRTSLVGGGILALACVAILAVGGESQDPAPAATTVATASAPLSSVVAVRLDNPRNFGNASLNNADTLPQYVKALVALYNANPANPDVLKAGFPVASDSSDSVRTLVGARQDLVVSWLDPLSAGEGGPRFGANCDYIAYFGDGWDEAGFENHGPMFNGRGNAGWIWVNHEYVSNDAPTLTSAPNGQALTFARFLRERGVLGNDVDGATWEQADVDKFLRSTKRELGGSWLRIRQDPHSGAWSVDPSAPARRYDATSDTLLRVTGYNVKNIAKDDTGKPLPRYGRDQVVPGIMGDCAGGVTPWGTIISAEENVQDYYGDLEDCWSGRDFVEGVGFDPGANIGANGKLDLSASSASYFGAISREVERHERDNYGFLCELDPGQDSTRYYNPETGDGHRKLGALGRARWESASFAVDTNWSLVEGKPITIYAGNDRRGGRIYKWVSSEHYRAVMTRAQVRALMDKGTLYVAHFADLDNATGYQLVGGEVPTPERPGKGTWIELSVHNTTQVAPNAGSGSAPEGWQMKGGTSVGIALQDVNWNGIGGFTNDDDVLRTLYTAACKIGVRELNRPEDIEYNPYDGRVYVAFTNNDKDVALDSRGVRFSSAQGKPGSTEARPKRDDKVGSIFAIEETGDGFRYWRVWRGSKGEGAFDIACPDNLLVDDRGGVWFGTDGNYGVNGTADGFYYLDWNGVTNGGTRQAFRVAAVPADAECTGPCFSSDLRSLFLSVQHPGESPNVPSNWPQR